MSKLVMFSQTFCGPCRQLKPHLEAAAEQLGYELEIRNIDTDKDTQWSRYNVQYTPTVFLIDEENPYETVIAQLKSTDPKIQPPNVFKIKEELESYNG
jgi:thiol-disulfide isomerase/thioredoxin